MNSAFRRARRTSPTARVVQRPFLAAGLGVAAICAGVVGAWAYPAPVPRVVAGLSVKVLTHPVSPTHATTARFTWRRTGTARAVLCKRDCGAFVRCSPQPLTYKRLKSGLHTFTIKVVGLHSTRSAVFRWRVDTIRPTAPTVSGGSLTWTTSPVTLTAAGSTDVGSGLSYYQHRASTDGGFHWTLAAKGATLLATANGETRVEFRSVDKAGNVSTWAPSVASAAATARVDVAAPTLPVLSGGSGAWQNTASADVTCTGSVDTGSGLAGYEYRTSTDNGATWSAAAPGVDAPVSAEGQTLVQFRALDVLGNASAWVKATVRIDRTAPTDPTLTGGSGLWKKVASVSVSAAGSTDSPGSGIAHYTYETSIDAGATWSAPVSGATAVISAEGSTLVRFQAVDNASLTSNWVQDQVWIDRTAPTVPVLAGGSIGWQNVPSVDITASGSVDTAAGFDHYQYETSADGGVTWAAAATGVVATVSAEGSTLVRFRAVDAVGNASVWVSAPVTIDRTPPTDPVLTGGLAAWQNVPSVTVKAAGATDAPGSGIASYEYQLSTDGGTTWTLSTTASQVVITGEGQTMVQFRSVDAAGFTSAWVPTEVWIDRSAPSVPTVSGGSLSWQNGASVTVSGAGSTDALSGVDHYRFQTSTDGGVTWSAGVNGPSASVSAAGQTVVRFRAVDAVGIMSAWTSSAIGAANIVRIDRTAPGLPSVSGGALTWKTAASTTITAAGSTDSGGAGLSGYESRTSTDTGATWSAPLAGPSVIVSSEGETLVQFRSVDSAGNRSTWAPASAGAGNTVRLDRTSPTGPTVSGGSLAWTKAASVTVDASGSSDVPSGVSGYDHRTSTDGGVTWSASASGGSLAVGATGETLVQFRSLDVAGNKSAWAPLVAGAGNTVRIDRTAPTVATVSGGSLAWTGTVPVTITASGSTDALSGLAGYDHRSSTDGGTTWSAATSGGSLPVAAQGQTLVEFRSVDNAGNVSAWTPSPSTAASTARVDFTAPSVPSVTGGSLTWRNAASTTVTGSASTDTGGSGLAQYEYRSSTDGGVSWSAPASGSSLLVSTEGETVVQFRGVDNAGNASGWVPAALTAGATVRLDRTAPSAPTLSGGSLAWQNVASVGVTGSGSTDGGAGINHYDYRTSIDNGVTWTAATAGPTATVSAEGQTLVQFRSVDGAANMSAWTPAVSTAGSTVRLDRGLPTAPAVSGGSLAWVNVGSVTITGAGSTDSGSGLAGYQSRTSVDGGTTWSAASASSLPGTLAVSAPGQTLVQFRSVDVAGNVSLWMPAAPAAANTVRIDRAAPTVPGVSGGSLSWGTLASETVSGSGSVDSGGAGFGHYEYQTALNGGAWSAAVSGPSVIVSVEGTTVVQFRAVDAAGNASAWAPAVAGAGNTVKLDRTAPTLPTVSGGRSCTKRPVKVTGSGSTDNGSGINHYEYHVSTNGGAYAAAVTGTSVTFSTTGSYVVHFRVVDSAGNTTAWAPATAGVGNSVCIR